MWLIVVHDSTGVTPWIVYRNRKTAVSRLEQDGWYYAPIEHRWLGVDHGNVTQTAVIVAVEAGDES